MYKYSLYKQHFSNIAIKSMYFEFTFRIGESVDRTGKTTKSQIARNLFPDIKKMLVFIFFFPANHLMYGELSNAHSALQPYKKLECVSLMQPVQLLSAIRMN